MAAGRLALLCLGLCLLIVNVASQRRCSVPVWRRELGSNPITATRGKVLLVALLRGYCSYCVGQARRLQALKNSLASQGFSDIAMVIVNGGEGISRSNVQNLRNASTFPVLQDTENHVMFRQIFHGSKDDFIVFDRCGQRVAYIPHPYSYLGNNVTERVLKAVHMGRHSCHCRLDPTRRNPHDVMYGDQPEGPTYTVNDNSLGLDCPENDTSCRSYLRNYRRNRLEPTVDSQQDRLSNRPRLRPLQEGHRNEQGHGHRGRGGQNQGGRNQQNHQNQQRHRQSGGYRIRNGTV